MVGQVRKIRRIGVWGLAALALVTSSQAFAGAFEISLGFGYNYSTYSQESFSWTRRWGASIGYYFSERAEIELAFQDVTDRTYVTGYEDTTFHDRVYSVNWVQGFLPRDFIVQPYLKLGVGQLNRDAEGSYASGGLPPAQLDTLTGVAGVGLKFALTRNFGLRLEGVSYLAGGSLKTWADNFAITAGGSFYF